MPVWGLWMDGRFIFSTDPATRKARNFQANPRVVIHLESADDVVVLEGSVEVVKDAEWLTTLNKAYAAKNHFATGIAKPPYNRSEFGYTVGGPIRKDKTFFFTSYESLRERLSRTNTLSVATANMRTGNFAGLPAIVDPLAGAPFANNLVPATRIDRARRP
jgi:hypothetical protein